MNISKIIRKLCTPARFYLGISIFMILLITVQNLFNNNSNELCIGSYKSDISEFANITVLLLFKILYIIFWTWLLNILCKNGLKSVSWFLVLLPFILFALSIALLVYSGHEMNEQNYIEPYSQGNHPSSQGNHPSSATQHPAAIHHSPTMKSKGMKPQGIKSPGMKPPFALKDKGVYVGAGNQNQCKSKKVNPYGYCM